MPAVRRISHTVDGATVTPSFTSSLRIRQCPHWGSSLARRTTRRAMLGTVGGRPGSGLGLRRLLVPYFFAASLRCPARNVAGEDISPPPGRYEPCQRGEPHPVGRRTASGQRAVAVRHSRAGAPAAQRPSPGRYDAARRLGRTEHGGVTAYSHGRLCQLTTLCSRAS